MGGKTISTSETKIEALKLQSSAYGVTIPVVGGVTRIAGNLIYQTDFKAVPTTTTQGGKGGGAKVQNTTYTYTTALLMALCHGQISAIPRIWVGKKKYGADAGAQTVNTATESFSITPGSVVTVVHSGAFSANVSVDSYNSVVGEAGLVGRQYAEGVDYTVKNGVYTFPSDTDTVNITYQYISTGGGSTALAKLGITLNSGSLSQPVPSWVTSRHPTEAVAYAGLAYVSADAYSLGTGAQVENHNFEVVGPGAYSLGSTIPDIDPAGFTMKVLQDARYGASFPSAYMNAATLWTNYCLANNLLMSPALTEQTKAAEFLSQMAQLTNTGILWSGGRVKMIPYGDVAATGNGVTFTPNVTPVYDLTDDAYIVAPGEAPVRVRRKKQSDAYNHIRLQFRNRGNDYASEISEAKDQADIEANGLRSADIVQADWICDANVARNIAQLMLQRSVNVRASFEFTLPYNFCALEPMDLVTLTDAGLGLSQKPVRITSVEEADGELRFEAEEFALGVASSSLYGTQVGVGFWQDYNAAPGATLAPVIFESPAVLSSTGLQIMVAAAGVGAFWGGARVWISMDGTNYREMGKLSGASRYGALTAAVSSTAAVALTPNTSILTSGSAADSAALSTLCYIGGASPEYLAFQTATLTGAGAYTLGGLTRGGYGTANVAHANGDPFVRVDQSVAASGALDLSMIGKTIHVKLTSFNVFGLAEENLSSVTDYTYTITGAMTLLAPSAPTGLAFTVEATGVRFTCNKNPEIGVLGYEWRIGPSGGSWSTATVLDKLGGTSVLWSTATPGNYVIYVAAVDKFGNESPQASLPVTITSVPQKYATAWLYQWATVAPSAPTGSRTYTWSTGLVSGTLGAWSATVPSNPGTPGLMLWATSQQVSDVVGATTTSFTWTSTTVSSIGSGGVQSAPAFCYQWASSTPTISGTSTYTWATGAFTPVPTGWTVASATAPGPGLQLYRASLNVMDSPANATTSINWSGASILVVGQSPYAGASSRIAYARFAGTTPTAGSISTSGSSSFPSSTQSNATWGFATSWSASDPNPASTNTLWQADGIYDPSTDTTVWQTPYISNLKVGSLSAITVNTGALTVTGAITVGSAGAVMGGQSAYNSGTGFFLGFSGGAYKFSIGNPSANYLTWNGSALAMKGGLIAGPASEFQVDDSTGNVTALKFFGFNSQFGNTNDPTRPAIYAESYIGTSQTSNVIYALQHGNAEAIRGEVPVGNTNAGAHGVRGYNYRATGAGTGWATVAANTAGSGSAGVGGFIGGANGYDFYADGNGQNYGPFTGTHDILFPNDSAPQPGQIVVDNGVAQRNGWSNTIGFGAVSSAPNQPGVLGVIAQEGRPLYSCVPAGFIENHTPGVGGGPNWYASYDDLKNDYWVYGANALGEGQVQVCGESGDIARGDLIVTSSLPGVGMKQADNVLRSHTVAKAREAVTFADATTPKAVACIYLCG